MKLKSLICTVLSVLMLLVPGCSEKTEVYGAKSKHYTFTREMAAYMVAYSRDMISAEMKAAGVKDDVPLADQIREGNETWEDYLYKVTADNIESILLYCEAAAVDGYAVPEGMIYKANENVSYILGGADDAGLSKEDYVKKLYGSEVTIEALTVCTQMMSLCEGYELWLRENNEVSFENAAVYADENPDDFLFFDILRYTTNDKAVADSLAASADADGFMSVMSGVSGLNLTDSDKNKIPDSIERTLTLSSDDPVCNFVTESDRKVGDTLVTGKDGAYTVTMIKTLPARNNTPAWDFRLIYISSESSTDPFKDASSLIEQWTEKKGGEEGFSNLAARYSDDPSAYYGGKFSCVTKDNMPTADVAEWVCDNTRTEGDVTSIPADEGAYMIYYIRGKIPMWQYEAASAATSKAVDEKITAKEKEIRKDFVIDESVIRSIIK